MVKDEKISVWYEEKFVLSPAEEHKWTPRVVGAMWEGTVEAGEDAGMVRAEKMGEVKAAVRVEIASQKQTASQARAGSGPVRFEEQAPITLPPEPSPTVPPPDPAEVPDMTTWYGTYTNNMQVSDLSKKDIDFYLNSNIVKNAKADDKRVQDFIRALEYWHSRAGDRRKGGR